MHASPQPTRDSAVRQAEETLSLVLRQAPDEGVSIADLIHATGMRRSWVYQRLQQAGRGGWQALPEVHDP